MNTKTLAALGAVLALAVVYTRADHFGTAFTYQGQLVSGGQAANGLYDLQFKLYDSLAGGTGQVGGTLTSNAVPVANGLFVVTLDFGDGIFTGPPRWLEIAVRTNAAVTFVTLSPRQPLNPSPYALYTPNADVAVAATTAYSVANNAVTAPGIAAGNVVKSVNALKDDVILAQGTNLTVAPSGQTITLSSPTDWHIGGNAGVTPGTQFLGTLDAAPLELRVNNQRALLTDTNGNLSAGSTSTIQLGGGTWGATIGGGFANTIQSGGILSTIAGGQQNEIQSGGWTCTIGGGGVNTIKSNGFFATIPGGYYNTVAGSYSFAAGKHANATNDGTFVWADSQAGDFGSSGVDQFLVRAGGGVGINKNHPATALDVNGIVTATGFSGPGASLTGLPASQLTGTIPSALLAGSYGNALTLNNPANSFSGDGSGLTSLNASQLASGTVPDARLSANVALLSRHQTFTGTNFFGNGSGAGRLIVNTSSVGKVDTNRFTGVSLQYDGTYGEGALMSSFDNGFASLSFYTKANSIRPVTKQMIISPYGDVAIDQGNNNDGAINTGTITGAGLTFGSGSGEGIASKRTTTGNQYGLDFYTGYARRMSLSQIGNLSMYDNTIYLRGQLGDGGFDQNHGLGYRGASIPFASTTPDGPVLFGYSGGALGTEQYGTEKIALSWNSSGYVGIGSTNPPVVPLDVYGTRAIDATTDGVLNVGDSASSHITLDGDDIQRKYGTTPSTLYLNYYGGNTSISYGGGNTYISGSQLSVISGSSGGVVVNGSANNGYKFYVNGTAYCTSGTWSGSDARWKKNVQPVTGALDKITQLQGVTYDWRREEFPAKEFEAGAQLGFLAQDVEKVVPEAVRTDADGYKAIAYEKLTAVLTEGVKEQQAEIEHLKAENAKLDRNVAELKALVEKLLQK